MQICKLSSSNKSIFEENLIFSLKLLSKILAPLPVNINLISLIELNSSKNLLLSSKISSVLEKIIFLIKSKEWLSVEEEKLVDYKEQLKSEEQILKKEVADLSEALKGSVAMAHQSWGPIVWSELARTKNN